MLFTNEKTYLVGRAIDTDMNEIFATTPMAFLCITTSPQPVAQYGMHEIQHCGPAQINPLHTPVIKAEAGLLLDYPVEHLSGKGARSDERVRKSDGK